MLTDAELAFFSHYTNYRLNSNGSAESEWARLADAANWVPGSNAYNTHRGKLDAVLREQGCGPAQPGSRKASVSNGGVPIDVLTEALGRLNVNSSSSTPGPGGSTVNPPTAELNTDRASPRHQGFSVPRDRREKCALYPAYLDQIATCMDSRLSVSQHMLLDFRVTAADIDNLRAGGRKLMRSDGRRAVEGDVAGLSNSMCKKLLSGMYVCVFDYVECKMKGEEVAPVFRRKKDFTEYLEREGKVFPKQPLKRVQCKAMVKALLEQLL